MSNNNMERKAILTEPPVDFWCKTKDVVDIKFRAAQGTIFVLYLRAFAPVTLRVSEIPCRLGM